MKKIALAALAAIAPAALASAAEFDASPVVEAELAFAAASAAHGIRDAFLEYAAPEAVLLRPGPVAAREHLEALPPTTTRLDWYPVEAALAASGDLGFTTGPWTARSKEDAPVSAQGHYLTVWRRQENGDWRYVLDHGISHPPLPGPPPVALRPGTPADRESSDANTVANVAATRALEEQDDRMNATLADRGGVAIVAALLEGGRVYREGYPPAIGTTAARALLDEAVPRTGAKRLGLGVSAAGDLGYSFGEFSGPGDTPAASYVRIWQRKPKGDWQLRVDLETPLTSGE